MKPIDDILIYMAVLGFSCTPNPGEKIVKNWHPVDVKGESVTKESKKNLLKPGNGMSFLEDGRFITYSPGDGNDTGTYILASDGKTLTVYSSQKNQTIFKIEELKSSRLVLENHGLILVLKPGK